MQVKEAKKGSEGKKDKVLSRWKTKQGKKKGGGGGMAESMGVGDDG